MAKAATKTLEQSFDALDEILAKLEQEDVTLEDSLKLYNDGMKLLKSCNDAIDKVEKKIIVVEEDK
ncbi:exodeoxyribonuclease VII small subunit [Lachnospiraceae bacterium KM106-2]|nr:exodeoxyribonuclease VII small subunit [Lachnospiraceae bacterium KM106-2]